MLQNYRKDLLNLIEASKDLIEARMTVLENIDSNEQSVAATRKSLQNSLCCYKALLREKIKSQVQVLLAQRVPYNEYIKY